MALAKSYTVSCRDYVFYRGPIRTAQIVYKAVLDAITLFGKEDCLKDCPVLLSFNFDD